MNALSLFLLVAQYVNALTLPELPDGTWREADSNIPFEGQIDAPYGEVDDTENQDANLARAPIPIIPILPRNRTFVEVLLGDLPEGWTEFYTNDGVIRYRDSNGSVFFDDPRFPENLLAQRYTAARTSLSLNIDRSYIYNSAFAQIMALSPEKLREHNTIKIHFNGEKGQDNGGLMI
jgi:hypothetical protein